jgi:hypothetical protein
MGIRQKATGAGQKAVPDLSWIFAQFWINIY